MSCVAKGRAFAECLVCVMLLTSVFGMQKFGKHTERILARDQVFNPSAGQIEIDFCSKIEVCDCSLNKQNVKSLK